MPLFRRLDETVGLAAVAKPARMVGRIDRRVARYEESAAVFTRVVVPRLSGGRGAERAQSEGSGEGDQADLQQLRSGYGL